MNYTSPDTWYETASPVLASTQLLDDWLDVEESRDGSAFVRLNGLPS